MSLYEAVWISVFVMSAGCGDGPASGTASGPDGQGDDTGDADGGNGDTDTESDSDTGQLDCGVLDSELAEGDAEALFDWPNVPTFDIFLPPEDWEQLQKDAQDEEYVEAQACFEGRGLGTVGLRFKGSYGSLYYCFDGDEMICRKLSIKLKFSEYEVDQRLFGMKRLNFHGYRWDTTYIKERLS